VHVEPGNHEGLSPNLNCIKVYGAGKAGGPEPAKALEQHPPPRVLPRPWRGRGGLNGSYKPERRRATSEPMASLHATR